MKNNDNDLLTTIHRKFFIINTLGTIQKLHNSIFDLLLSPINRFRI